MTVFIGILDGSGGVYGLRVPDLPGVNGGGATPEAAIADAISAAREWAEYQQAKGVAIPAPRSLDPIRPEIEEGETPVTIVLALAE